MPFSNSPLEKKVFSKIEKEFQEQKWEVLIAQLEAKCEQEARYLKEEIERNFIIKEGGKFPLRPDFRLKMEDFPFSEEKKKEDEKSVQERKNRWRKKMEKIQGKTLSLEELEKIINHQKGIALEKLVKILFYKHLSEDFICVRTSEYDDYVNGVDNLIVSKKTGEVIAAVDLVTGFPNDPLLKGATEMEERTTKLNEKGGVKIEYGFKISGITIELTSIEGVPVFYIVLLCKDLLKALEELGNVQTEREILRNILTQLRTQGEKLSQMERWRDRGRELWEIKL